MTVCMYRDIHTLQPYIIDFIQRGCHTLRLCRVSLQNKFEKLVHPVGFITRIFHDPRSPERHI